MHFGLFIYLPRIRTLSSFKLFNKFHYCIYSINIDATTETSTAATASAANADTRPTTKSKAKSTKASRKLAKLNAQDLSTNASANSFASISRDSIYAKSSSSAIRPTYPISHLDASAHSHTAENDIAEVLDCRIAEKIQNELENKLSIEECAKAMAEGVANAVALTSAAATAAAAATEAVSASTNEMYEPLPSTVVTKAKKKVIFKEKRKSKMKNRMVGVEEDGGGDGHGDGGGVDEKERLEELLAIEKISQQIIKGDFGLRGYKIDPEPNVSINRDRKYTLSNIYAHHWLLLAIGAMHVH